DISLYNGYVGGTLYFNCRRGYCYYRQNGWIHKCPEIDKHADVDNERNDLVSQHGLGAQNEKLKQGNIDSQDGWEELTDDDALDDLESVSLSVYNQVFTSCTTDKPFHKAYSRDLTIDD
ncbi:hypothetical protein BGZ76_005740, partial [Entomortierella beljakovae]